MAAAAHTFVDIYIYKCIGLVYKQSARPDSRKWSAGIYAARRAKQEQQPPEEFGWRASAKSPRAQINIYMELMSLLGWFSALGLRELLAQANKIITRQTMAAWWYAMRRRSPFSPCVCERLSSAAPLAQPPDQQPLFDIDHAACAA